MICQIYYYATCFRLLVVTSHCFYLAEGIVRIAGFILTGVAGNLLAVLFLSAYLNRDSVFILRTAALRTL